MKFEEVLSALREGKKIRRAFWWGGHYLKLVSNGIIDQDGKSLTFGKEDLIADDWEVVKETKKVRLRDLTWKQYTEWVENHCQEYNEYCDKCPFQKVKCENDGGQNSLWINNKDLYSDKFLDQEIEIEVEENNGKN